MNHSDNYRLPNPRYQWHNRGYIPHCEVEGGIQTITFRLADALPEDVLERMKHELEIPEGAIPRHLLDLHKQKMRQLRWSIEKYCDAGHGSCILARHGCAEIVEESLCHWDGKRYRLIAWSIMPNHIHTMIEIDESNSLGRIVGSWKQHTAREMKRSLGDECPASMRVKGASVWQAEYWDRYIRDDMHLTKSLEYIESNPVKAGLVNDAKLWRWSSARLR